MSRRLALAGLVLLTVATTTSLPSLTAAVASHTLSAQISDPESCRGPSAAVRSESVVSNGLRLQTIVPELVGRPQGWGP